MIRLPEKNERGRKKGGRYYFRLPPFSVSSTGADAYWRGYGTRRTSARFVKQEEARLWGNCSFARTAWRVVLPVSPFAKLAPIVVSFRCHICGALDSAKHRRAAAEEYKNRCDLLFVRKDIFVVRPWMVDLRCAPSVELRGALLHAKKHLPLANASGSGDVLGQGSDVPSGGTSLFSMPARMCGSGTRAGQVAMEDVDSIRLSRALHMQYK